MQRLIYYFLANSSFKKFEDIFLILPTAATRNDGVMSGMYVIGY